MTTTSIRRGFAAAILGAALLVPVPIGLSGGVVRVNDACGQATECKRARDYICSTEHQDWQDYQCTKGCDVTIE